MENKKRGYTPAQNKATQKYIKNNYDEIKIRLEKGKKDIIKDHVLTTGESMNSFIIRAISTTMESDNAK